MKLRVDGLSFKYGKNIVLDDVSFEIKDGDILGILGNNGVGKSTLVKCLNKILTPFKGNIYINDTDIKKMSRNSIAQNIAYVSQSSDVFDTTVFDSIMLGRLPYIKIAPTKRDYNVVENVINDLGISDISMRIFSQLSGGQKQKVLIARALAQEPKILLLDEPTNSLDMKSQHHLLNMVKNIAKNQDIIVVEVLHDINIALKYCNKFLLLKDGKVAKRCCYEHISEDVLKDIFGIDVCIEEIKGQKTVVFLSNDDEEINNENISN